MIFSQPSRCRARLRGWGLTLDANRLEGPIPDVFASMELLGCVGVLRTLYAARQRACCRAVCGQLGRG